MDGTKRNPFKILLFTLLHWCLVVVLSFIAAIVQYSFLVDTGETYSSFIFSGSIYRVNYATYLLGIVIFLIGYQLLWKRFLLPDWDAFAECFWGWRILYILIALVAMAVVFFAGVISQLFVLGLGGTLTPAWTEWGFMVYLLDIAVVAIVEIVRSGSVRDRKS